MQGETFLTCARRNLSIYSLAALETNPRPQTYQACVHHTVIPTLSSPLIPIYQQESETIAMVNWAQVIVLRFHNTLTTEANIVFNSNNINDFSRKFQTCSPLIALEIHKYVCV